MVNFGDRELNRKQDAVLPTGVQRARTADNVRLACLSVLPQICVVALAFRQRHQDTHILADSLIGRIAEELHCRSTERNDLPRRIDRNHGVRARIQNRRNPVLAVLQLAGSLHHSLLKLCVQFLERHFGVRACTDILHDDLHARNRTLAISQRVIAHQPKRCDAGRGLPLHLQPQDRFACVAYFA